MHCWRHFLGTFLTWILPRRGRWGERWRWCPAWTGTCGENVSYRRVNWLMYRVSYITCLISSYTYDTLSIVGWMIFLCINKIVKYKTRIFNNCISRIIDYLTSLLERTASDGWQGSLVACRGCRTWSTVVASCTARTSINAVRKLTYCRGVPWLIWVPKNYWL